MSRVEIVRTLGLVDKCEPGKRFKLSYSARNMTSDAIAQYCDVIQFQDEWNRELEEHRQVLWYKDAATPLPGTTGYEFEPEIKELPAGLYRVWLILDARASADGEEPVNMPVWELRVSADDEDPWAEGAGPGAYAHRSHIDVVAAPELVEPLLGGVPFAIRYEAYNAGGQRTPEDGHVDGFWIDGTVATWWTRWRQERLDPQQHYWPTLEVPGLPAGDYQLKWKLDAGEVDVRPPADATEGNWFRIQGQDSGDLPAVNWLSSEAVGMLAARYLPVSVAQLEADEFWSWVFDSWLSSGPHGLTGYLSVWHVYKGLAQWQGKYTGYTDFCQFYLGDLVERTHLDSGLMDDVLRVSETVPEGSEAGVVEEAAVPAMTALAASVERRVEELFQEFLDDVRKVQAQLI